MSASHVSQRFSGTVAVRRVFGDVAVEVGSDRVGVITLDRPERLNAVTGHTFDQIRDGAGWVGDQPCGAIVLTGAGRAFSAGMDRGHRLAPAYSDQHSGWDEHEDPVVRDHFALRSGVAAILALREIPQLVIAAVRGHAVGAGFSLAAAADLRLCAPDARFIAPFLELGTSAGDLGLSWFLPRIIGHARAAELFLTAGTLDADAAERTGLVSRAGDRSAPLHLFLTLSVSPVSVGGPMYLTQALHRAVQQDPDEVYSVCSGRSFTNRQVADRVAILALNSDTYLQLLLAVPWADAVLVPVNTRLSAKEIAYSLVESGVEVSVVDDTFAGMVPALREAVPGLREVVHCGEGAASVGTTSLARLLESDPIPDARRGGESLAGIFYTGGTTGFPKGVMLSHRNLMVSAMGYGATGTLPVGGRTMHVAPIFHLAALAMWVSTSLTGAAHVMLPPFDLSSLEVIGYVFIVDRIKDMTVSGGENVYSVEVENVIARHPAVAQCAVIGVPDDQWGERVHAIVILATVAGLTVEEIREHCRTEIAGYKCPRSLEIVEAFPMSAAGKILKRDLRKAYR